MGIKQFAGLYGPASFYEHSGSLIEPAVHGFQPGDGLKYKVFFESDDGTHTPTLSQVEIDWE